MNRLFLSEGKGASCYHCLRLFLVASITDWSDHGQTAHCPHCGVDAVVPRWVSREELAELHAKWFGPAPRAKVAL
ncbi:MAG: hypothetical protein ACRDF8_06640 [Chloroflexota bacterium]